MPSPRPKPSLGLRDFRRPALGKKAPDIPPRAKQLIELMTVGPADGSAPPMTLDQAAVRMGIKRSTAAYYFRLPGARSFYLQILQDLREGERVQNLHAAVGIRDDDEMKKTAAGNRVRLEAVRFLENRDGGITINNTVGVGVNLTPGYQVAIPAEYADKAMEILKKSGSTKMLGEGGKTIDLAGEGTEK